MDRLSLSTDVPVGTQTNHQKKSGFGLFLEYISYWIPTKSWDITTDEAFLFTVPAAAEWAGPCSRGGGGGRPGEDVNSAPELARDGGRRGPEDAEPLVEGVGGRMVDEDATAGADEGGLTGVLLLRRKEELLQTN